MRYWRRSDVVDEYSEAGEGVILMADGAVVALSALGWSIMDAIGIGVADEAGLVNKVVDQHGVPQGEDGRDLSQELVASALDELAGQGLIAQVQGDGSPQ